MAFSFPSNTKFAAMHLAHCSSRALPEMLALDHGLSVHSSPVMDLTDMDKARLGTDRTEAFKRSIALMASMPSTTAGILDAESRQLEHRVNMLFYGILMQGVPELGTVIVALGSKQNGREPWANSLIVMAHYYRHPDVSTFNVTPDVLHRAGAVVPGLIEAFPGPNVPEFARLRRGVRSLEAGWRGERATDRIHMFVRALDGLMKLEQNMGERGFVARTAMIARGQHLEDVAREIYRLRSYDEHLSDWPSKLRYVKERDRNHFVSHRAFHAEVLAGEAYRLVLGEPAVRRHFRTNEDIERFWTQGATAWGPLIDLDTHELSYRFIGEI